MTPVATPIFAAQHCTCWAICSVLPRPLLASLAVLMFGWLYADPVLTLLIVVILSRGAYYVVKESAHILLEGVPEGVNLGGYKNNADQ